MKYKILVLILISITSIFYIYNHIPIFTQKSIYVSTAGNDANIGSKNYPYRTIQHAVDLAYPGTTINILPGTYRESVIITKSGTKQKPIKIVGSTKDKNSVILNGAEPSSQMTWKKCSPKICPTLQESTQNSTYFTSLDWQETPYLVNEIAPDGKVQQLQIARTPNYVEEPDGKYHKDWWTATNTFDSDRVLEDVINLKGLNGVENSKIFLTDGGTRCGGFLYTNNVDLYESSRGKITFKNPVGFSVFGSQEKGIGPYTKYFLEGKLEFIDTPGEWFYDKNGKNLYIWPMEDTNPKNLNIEISKRSFGIGIQKASNITIDGLDFIYFNDNPEYISPYNGTISLIPSLNSIISDINLDNIGIKNSVNGINSFAQNSTSKVENILINHFHGKNILGNSLSFIASDTAPSNINGIQVSNSEFSNSSFNSDYTGLNFIRISGVKFYKNYMHNLANYGIHFTGFERNNSSVKNISVKNNIIINVCENVSACAGLKFWGGKYENTTAENNIISDTGGWSYCNEKKYGHGLANGIFISNASGIKLQNNILLNNTGNGIEIYPRQIETINNIISNNLIGYSSVGVDLSNPKDTFDLDSKVNSTRHDGTAIKNNIFLGNKIGLFIDSAHPQSIAMDYNAFMNNGIDMEFQDTSLTRIEDSRNIKPYWNLHSIDTDNQVFRSINKQDFNLPYSSILRGRGEPGTKNRLLQANLDLLGLANDIGPCKFRWIGNSCPILGKD